MRLIRSRELKGQLLDEILNRGRLELESVAEDVKGIIESISTRGDEALFEFTQKFDGVRLDSCTIRATREDVDAAYSLTREVEVRALRKAASNIKRFHKMQFSRIAFEQSSGGVTLGVSTRPVSSVGIYAPGGKTSYPSSVLMCAIPAKIAGVERIVVCSPPSPKRKFNPYILVASDIAGVDEIFCVGGAQAIAAMAYGTKTISPVEKIVGPGNIYVTAAKQLLSERVSVDLPAGPSEILIIADDSANTRFITSDLLAQAEHDENATCILLTSSERIANEVRERVGENLKIGLGSETARIALDKKGIIIIVDDLEEATTLTNLIAPEHVVIMTRDASRLFPQIRNAGLIFLGQYSPVAVGDYSAGTNHVLPTGGSAKNYSGLSVKDFVKTISYVRCSKEGLKRLAKTTVTLAEIENLRAHSESIKARGV